MAADVPSCSLGAAVGGVGAVRTVDPSPSQSVDSRLLVSRAVLSDATAIVLALSAAYGLRLWVGGGVPEPVWLLCLAVLLVAWAGALLSVGAYDSRAFGLGAEDYKLIASATFRAFAVVMMTSYLLRLNLSRGIVAAAMPVGLALLLAGRLVHRSWLARERDAGRQVHHVVLVGDHRAVADLTRRLSMGGAFRVVGACLPDGQGCGEVARVGGLDDVRDAALRLRADTVAVAASAEIAPERLRQIAWDLEGTGISLTVASQLADVAGPRLAVRPVAGLPLIHVDEPRFRGFARVLKGALDYCGAAVLVLVSVPMFVLVAVAIKLEDGGAILFRQTRIGIDGRPFTLWKFRTMVEGAETQRGELVRQRTGQESVLLFKAADDPRVTPLGRILRRYSLDELPQLFNVLRGQMSLVGPRPPLIEEAALYDDATRRRLRVKPGLTGLWQVSGRSDVTQEEAVRLDLYYVENWSPALDLALLLRTVTAVLTRRGAY